jgi:hypothetical protein
VIKTCIRDLRQFEFEKLMFDEPRFILYRIDD